MHPEQQAALLEVPRGSSTASVVEGILPPYLYLFFS
jgi:hypothetical protein